MPRKPVAGTALNRSDLAAFHGVSLPTVDSWVRDGCPCQREGGKGSAYMFDSADVINWRLAKAREGRRKDGGAAGTIDEAKLRHETAKAELAEIELATKRAEVVPIGHVTRQIGKLLANVRARMLAIPTKVAPVAQVAASAEEARALIEAEIRDGLTELVDAGAVLAGDADG